MLGTEDSFHVKMFTVHIIERNLRLGCIYVGLQFYFNVFIVQILRDTQRTVAYTMENFITGHAKQAMEDMWGLFAALVESRIRIEHEFMYYYEVIATL